jgi:hypothetical protein
MYQLKNHESIIYLQLNEKGMGIINLRKIHKRFTIKDFLKYIFYFYLILISKLFLKFLILN